jgi:hypothetical protein
MPVSAVGRQGGVVRPHEGCVVVLVLNVLLGLPAYFIAFLFAYGFEDDVDLANHLTFLVLIAMYATFTGAFSMALFMTPEPRPPLSARVAFGVPMSLALNSAVVGIGSIVSATHKDEGSVSAGFSTVTDVLVASGLFVVAIALAAAASRVDLQARLRP